MAYISTNPATGQINGEFVNLTENEFCSVLDRSYSQFLLWKNRDIKSRSEMLLRLAEELEDNSIEHGETITIEMGKPISQSIAEVKKSALACRYYAENAEEFLKPSVIKGSSGESYISYEPQGLVFAIMPWNFPYWQVIRCIAPALVSGNGVLLKHASNVPLSALKIEQAVLKAGFPEYLFKNLFINHDQVEKVIESSFVRSVSLTGSNSAGEVIASKAGEAITRTVLELGGSDPFIVFPDADIKAAVDGVIMGRFLNSGQSCIASKRLFLHEDIFERFLALLKARVEVLRVGDPTDPETFIGPLVDNAACIELDRQLSESVKLGGEIVAGGRRGEDGSCYFDPVIIVNAPPESPVAVEETFGPVLPVFTFNEYESVITDANSSQYGLASSVWTRDRNLIKKVARDLDSGSVSINGFSRSDPALPFGGVKSSGYGRELSRLGLLEFVNIKTVTIF